METLRADGEWAESTLEHGGNVSAETCIPAWCGERMEDDLMVAALFELEAQTVLEPALGPAEP